MAYTKTTWNTGDVITAEKLNHMEDGIASGGVVTYNLSADDDNDTYVSPITFEEAKALMQSGKIIVLREDTEEYSMIFISMIGSFASGRYLPYIEFFGIDTPDMCFYYLNSDNTFGSDRVEGSSPVAPNQ